MKRHLLIGLFLLGLACSQVMHAQLTEASTVANQTKLASSDRRLFVDSDSPGYYSPAPAAAEASDPAPVLAIQPVTEETNRAKIQWGPATWQAMFSTGIMHTFNLWTEAGTRDTLYGPWLKDYFRSVSELRGWSDSDRFMAPYVGHTIQGSSYGFILRQNDPKYRTVQWGDGHDYFISALRSMAFAAVWHTQWKIGPMSEASIGNVMLHASPGFITLVNTPTLGTVALMGEDAADRYLITGLENRTANRTLIILARGFLNPGRSFANVMAFKAPWVRDTRIGLFGDNYRLRKAAIADYKNGSGEKLFQFTRRAPLPSGPHPDKPLIELAAFPNFEHFFGERNCIGGGGSGAARVSPSLQVIAEVNGCLMMGMPAYNESGDSLFYGGGIRWSPEISRRISPHCEVLFGGKKLTYEVDDPELKKSLMEQWSDGTGTLPHYPKRSDWSTQVVANGPSIAAGGGLDVIVNRAFTLRMANLEYTHAWIGNAGIIDARSGIRFTTEAVLRIGTW